MVLFEPFAGEPEVNQRQQHEDESLNEANEQHIEKLPDRQRDRSREPWSDVRQVSKQQRDHEDHEQAGKQVSEQPKSQSCGLRDLLDDVEAREEDAGPDRKLEGPREVVQVTPQAPKPYRIGIDQNENDER